MGWLCLQCAALHSTLLVHNHFRHAHVQPSVFFLSFSLSDQFAPCSLPPSPGALQFEIARARAYYAESDAGIPMLAPASRMAVQSAGDIYKKILDKIEANDYDNFRKRAYVPRAEKFLELPKVWLKTSAMPEGR